MPDKLVRDEILRSHRYQSLSSDTVKLLFFHLMLTSDHLSNCEVTTTALGFALGRAVDQEAAAQLLSELADRDLIRLYQVEGKPYAHIPRSRQRIRYLSGKHPRPPSNIEDKEIIELIDKVGLQSDHSQTQVSRSEEKRREVVPSRKSAKAADSGIEHRRLVWIAYGDAYKARYGVEPADSAEARSAIKRFCALVPNGDAEAVAGYFVRHNGSFYVEKGHNPKLLAADAAKLRTECITGRQITRQAAIEGDKLATRGNMWKGMIDDAKGKP